ncbi:hypothetical protein [Curtobacterium sp. MCBA15_008]|uniref:hypothetical protein n=1 Tax=Curtobacterium sp. MCBA15_008 TaxID=1898736 RepID=UPI0008DE10F4|nr:hypothetical protein [Curtobacterium sp. MCBA15_008]OII06953.1 hypothetical protein BIU96_05105 [Curtobacterium sp. MCBA15_008]
MNFDGYVAKFDVEHLAGLDAWRQGLLVPTWVGAYVDLTDAESDDSQASEDPHPFEAVQDLDDAQVPFVAVTSQTCDVVGAGPGARHPFVQVSPVRDLSTWDPAKLQLVRSGEINDWILLTEPPVDGAIWAIDLRASWPFSKTALATTAPVVGFASADDEREIGARLARKYERPAFPDAITTTAARRLDAAVERGMKAMWATDVVQLRLDVMKGTVLEPEEVRLLVVSEGLLDPASRRQFRDAWSDCKRPIQDAGIKWTRAGFRDIERMSAREYRDTFLLRIPKLSSGSLNAR